MTIRTLYLSINKVCIIAFGQMLIYTDFIAILNVYILYNVLLNMSFAHFYWCTNSVLIVNLVHELEPNLQVGCIYTTELLL